MQSDTKIAVVLRNDLAVWQTTNVTPFLVSGIAAHRIVAALDAGEVLINGAQNLAVHRPFGGFGISGVGKECGRAGFEEFLRGKSIAIAVH